MVIKKMKINIKDDDKEDDDKAKKKENEKSWYVSVVAACVRVQGTNLTLPSIWTWISTTSNTITTGSSLFSLFRFNVGIMHE